MISVAARRRQFRKMELAVLYAPRGKRAAARDLIQAERLKDLRAAADMTREGWVPPEPDQGEMFAGIPCIDRFGIAAKTAGALLADTLSNKARGP